MDTESIINNILGEQSAEKHRFSWVFARYPGYERLDVSPPVSPTGEAPVMVLDEISTKTRNKIVKLIKEEYKVK